MVDDDVVNDDVADDDVADANVADGGVADGGVADDDNVTRRPGKQNFSSNFVRRPRNTPSIMHIQGSSQGEAEARLPMTRKSTSMMHLRENMWTALEAG